MLLRIIAVVIVAGVLGTGAAYAVVKTQAHATNTIEQDVQQYGDRAAK